jgi:hypothetical protein
MYSHQCTVKCTVLDFIVMCLPCRLHKPDPRPTPLPAPTKGLFAGMSKEHIRPRSDYITALALARTHAENQSGSRPHPKPDVPTHLRKPSMIIPDLRFEPTYLAKLAAADPGWQSVIWVTIRDQVISPLLQGALWYVRLLLNLGTFVTGHVVQGHRDRVHTAFDTFRIWVALS